MKKLLLAIALVLAAQAPAQAETDSDPPVNILLAGGDAANKITIQVTRARLYYVISSIVPLEAGGTVCFNPPGKPKRLLCHLDRVASFEFNAGAGNDRIRVSSAVKVPVTMRGGPGHDKLHGGRGPDRIYGGPGFDRIFGRGGDDVLFGGDDPDIIVGGWGDDRLRGGRGRDFLVPGFGRDKLRQ